MDITANYADYEDDAFYVELKRQILQLITTDDDTAQDFQETGSGSGSLNNRPAPTFLNRWSDNGGSRGVWKACEGTGVFIPRAKSRKRNKSSNCFFPFSFQDIENGFYFKYLLS